MTDLSKDERLTALLHSARADSISMLQPDPHLPARIRAMDGRCDAGAGIAPRRPRWARVSLGMAAAAIALALGGYLGYAARTAGTEAGSSQNGQAAETLLAAWSQSGLVEEWSVLANDPGTEQP